MNGNLERAKRKAKHHYKRVWCGYFTPSEILALIDAGVRPTSSQEWVVERAKKMKSAGISDPGWFYFEPNGVVVYEEVPQSTRKRSQKT